VIDSVGKIVKTVL